VPVGRLLVISNGHGEDSIAAQVIRRLPSSISASAYPTLGDGRAYDGVCPIVGPRRHLPSEGHRTRGSLRRDAKAGLGIGPAMRFMRTEAKTYDAILVVGDMLGVLMCWLSGLRARIYLDVYKSGHDNAYSRAEKFVLRHAASLVLTRDPILAAQLQAARVNARFAGNVMMDTLGADIYDARARRSNPKAIAVLPGSRASMPENFALQLDALRRVPGIEGIDVFVVLARADDIGRLADLPGLRYQPPSRRDGDLGRLLDGRVTMHLASGALGPVVSVSDVVLGQAGTANLQAIGLGRPVVSFHVEDATDRRRARNEALAGEARLFVDRDPDALAAALARLLADDAERQRRGAIGRERMGPPGAIDAIIAQLAK